MWKTEKIGDVCELATGGTPSRKKKEYFDNGDIKWLVSGDINQREIFDCEGRITSEGMANSNAKYLPENSVLIALNGQGKTRGTVALLRTKATCNQSLVSISPKVGVALDTKFLFYVLDGMYGKIRTMTGDSGNDRRGLNMPLIRGIEIPLPPLAEQQRIVAKLDAAFMEIHRAVETCEQQICETVKLQSHSLTSLFVSNGHAARRLSELAKIKGGKRLPKGKKLTTEDTGFPYLRVADFNDNGSIDEESVQFVKPDVQKQISKYTISSDDVYVSIAGTIGKTGVVPPNLDNANLTENAAKLVLNEGVDRDFVYFFTRTSSFEKQAIAQTRQAAQPKLALERLGAVEIPIYEVQKQRQIASDAKAITERIAQVIKNRKDKLVELAALKSAILAQELQPPQADSNEHKQSFGEDWYRREDEAMARMDTPYYQEMAKRIAREVMNPNERS